MKHFKQSKPGKSSKGFYVALGLCLMAVGVASWVTFDSMRPFTEDDSSSQWMQTEKVVSGVKVPSSSASSSSSVSSALESSSLPESSQEAPSSSSSQPVSSQSEPPTVSTGTSPESSAVPTPDALQYPLGNSISKGFSGEELLFSETMKDWRAHTGADLPGEVGDSVKASAAGIVKSVSSESIYGVTVVVDHGDLTVSYCGLGTTSVEAGQFVGLGDVLGTLGDVPCETADGPHLHLEVSREGTLLDPASLLQ